MAASRTRVGDPERQFAVLPRSQNVSWPADFKIGLGNLKAVRDRLQGRQPPQCLGRIGIGKQEAIALELPRLTRPRNWCSCDSPKRWASSMTMIVALGTSTPTSTTVVDTSTLIRPCRNASMTAVFAFVLDLPVDQAHFEVSQLPRA